MKKGIVVALMLVLAISFSSVALAKTVLKYAHIYDPSHPVAIGSEMIAKIVAEKTNGEVEIQVFPASQLGSEEAILEAAIFGSVDIASSGAGQIGNLFKPVLVLEMPYTFKDNDHVIRFAKSDIAKQMADDLRQEFGVKIVGTTPYGIRQVTSNKPVKSPADLEGFKLRVPEQNVCIEYAKAMGADPTPIAFSEVYLALQQGVVDGQENSLSTIKAMKFYEVQKYVNLTRHVTNCLFFVMNDAKFQSLTAEQQQIILDAFDEAANYIAAELNKGDQELGKFFESEGVTIVEPDLEAFRKATADMPDKFKKWWIRYGDDLHKRIQDL